MSKLRTVLIRIVAAASGRDAVNLVARGSQEIKSEIGRVRSLQQVDLDFTAAIRRHSLNSYRAAITRVYLSWSFIVAIALFEIVSSAWSPSGAASFFVALAGFVLLAGAVYGIGYAIYCVRSCTIPSLIKYTAIFAVSPWRALPLESPRTVAARGFVALKAQSQDPQQ